MLEFQDIHVTLYVHCPVKKNLLLLLLHFTNYLVLQGGRCHRAGYRERILIVPPMIKISDLTRDQTQAA